MHGWQCKCKNDLQTYLWYQLHCCLQESHGLDIGTGVTALISPLDPTKPVCLLEYNEACIHDFPTSLYSNYQMRETGIVVDNVSSKHKKDSQGNIGTQSLQVPEGTSLPLCVMSALPVMSIRKPTIDKLVSMAILTYVLTLDVP